MTYEELLEKARETYESEDTPHVVKAWLLANIIGPAGESEDERIKQEIVAYINDFADVRDEKIPTKWFNWLDKQGESNPYSGVSFKYNGHIWGMCARDNGVDILLDKQLFKHLEKQDEQPTDKVEPKILLNANEVTDWLDCNICNAYDYDGNDISTTLKSKFKGDFGL